MTSSEIVSQNYRFDTGALRNIESFEDALSLFGSDILTADVELGDGFELLKNKDRLIDEPCFFLSWSFSKGEFSDEFVSARVVTKSGGKFVLNDGGTGIRAQLREFSDSHKGRMGGLLARHGLRKSEYEYADEKTGDLKGAVTYYISTSA